MESEMLYRKLQEHLDRMPVPFPATESGVEIRILKQLFTPAEAEIALNLSAIPEPARVIHKRSKSPLTLEEFTAELDRMSVKGNLQKMATGGEARYGKLMFAIGMYERQVNRLTPEFEQDAREYLVGEFGRAMAAVKTTQLRVVPVNRSITPERTVASYEQIREYIRNSAGPFAKGNCICRQGRDLVGHKCQQTDLRENCLTFGMAAQWMSQACGSRLISREEMLALLDEADRQGLVLETENSQQPLFVCCCCHCCCGVLNAVKQFDKPADYFTANFYAAIDEAACQNCGTCETRCQMEAIRVNGKTEVLLERCIGCGLCVTTCPSEAMHLEAKPEQKVPPKDIKSLYLKMTQERFGKWGMAKAGAKTVLGMKV